MIHRFRMCFVACMTACAASHAQRIEVLSAKPTLGTVGGVGAQCEFTEGKLVLRVQASCVVDSEKRIVVKNFETDEIVLDSKSQETKLPNFPRKPSVQAIQLPCDRERLEKTKHHLLVSLSGKCGREHAAGSFECVTKKGGE